MGEVISLEHVRMTRSTRRRSMEAMPFHTQPGVDVYRAAGTANPARHREPLWREVAGRVLRSERRRQGRTLAHVAQRAGMSVQYLSEIERGRKEPSSEMLAAACGSLGLSLTDFMTGCARMTSPSARPSGPVLLAA